MFTAQSWTSALGMLGRAAAHGDRSARLQLSAMTGIADPRGEWERLAAGFDLRGWLGKPASEPLRGEASILRFPKLLSAAVCAWLIEQARGRLVRARVYDPIGKRETVDEMRSNTRRSSASPR